MNEVQTRPGLPPEHIDRLTRPIGRFLRIETAAGAILLMFAVAALVLSNSPWAHGFLEAWETPLGITAGSFEYVRSAREWINDGLMTLFFFLVALELKRELVLGELRNPRAAALSIAGAFGGMLVPALFYLALQWGKPGQNGWGTVMATDTAFVIGSLALLGSRVPQSLRIFMLSLAIVDDIGAILVVAVGYGNQVGWGALAAAAGVIAAFFVLTWLGVRSLVFYFLLGGFVWIAVDASGIHATVTGVILGLMTPTGTWVSDERLRSIFGRIVAYPAGDHWSGDTEDRQALRTAEAAARESLSPVERLEMLLHPWVAFAIMPLFAFANAGVTVMPADFVSPIAVAIIAGFVLGKPIGILAFSWLAVRTGIATRPADLGWREMVGGGLLAGIGFTMALFIADLAFAPDLLAEAKVGILSASAVSAVLGIAVLTFGAARSRRV